VGEDKKSGKDRHKFPRIKSSNLVSYEIIDSYQPETEGLGVTQNISLGGLMFEVGRMFPVDTVMSIEVALYDKIIKADVRVAHIREIKDGKYDIGMKFVKIDQADFNTLWDYLENKKKK